MPFEPLMMACTSDLSGRIRGKGYPLADHEQRCRSGVGWTPANALITCFDTIAPGIYGSCGDLILRPDAAATVNLGEGEPDLRFSLGNILNLDGSPWVCCTRSLAQAASERLERETGLRALVAFEHEFVLETQVPLGGSFSLEGFIAGQGLGGRIVAALRKAGMKPDTFLREYGAGQFEITIDPALDVAAADQAVILREIVRHEARRDGHRACFAPLPSPDDVGTGVHVHISLQNTQGRPVAFDATRVENLSDVAGSFVAGIQRHMPAIVALTAPSVASYFRLIPHRWSAAFNNLAARDREAAIRICPLTGPDDETRARQFNWEYRAADATAGPYLVLAALLHAGCQGIVERLPAPRPTDGELDKLTEKDLAASGIQRLPQTLDSALDLLGNDPLVAQWFPSEFLDVYIANKRGEIAYLSGQDKAGICAAYRPLY